MSRLFKSDDGVGLVDRARRVVARTVKKHVRLRDIRQHGLAYVPPNFIYLPDFKPGAVVIDAGCGYEADFSIGMIERHGARAYAVDPTLKHRDALQQLERSNPGKFTHLPFAISKQDGMLTFHQSNENESGSIFDSHSNVRRDEIVSYEVRSITIRSLLDHICAETVELLKLDIEGAEYALLDDVQAVDLAPFNQIFIEFHHHAVAEFSEDDTARIVRKISQMGFDSYTVDDHNYLFVSASRKRSITAS